MAQCWRDWLRLQAPLVKACCRSDYLALPLPYLARRKYVFPGRAGKPSTGEKRPPDPSVPITSLKTAWRNVKERAGVTGRWHDARHTLVTGLAESGAGDQTIMDIAGHVSRNMLKHYSHIRMEAKRQALEGIVPKAAAVRSPRGKTHEDARPVQCSLPN